MKCPICKKPLKEDTDGNLKYCQGHDTIDMFNRLTDEEKAEKFNING